MKVWEMQCKLLCYKGLAKSMTDDGYKNTFVGTEEGRAPLFTTEKKNSLGCGKKKNPQPSGWGFVVLFIVYRVLRGWRRSSRR